MKHSIFPMDRLSVKCVRLLTSRYQSSATLVKGLMIKFNLYSFIKTIKFIHCVCIVRFWTRTTQNVVKIINVLFKSEARNLRDT